MTKIIAEIGSNHGGDISLAKEMTIAASESGADIVKFQVWSVKNLKNGPWDGDGRTDLYKKSELTKEKILHLYEFCLDKNIKFLVSVFNKEDLALLPNDYSNIIKIPSTEIDNLDLLKSCKERFDEIIVSTGSSTVDEVHLAYDICFPCCMMHCVNIYPCSLENANLSRINLLKNTFPRVGYSDHTIGLSASMYAISHNCEYVEKHFTTNRELPGRDNKFSILPGELKELCSIRDQINTMTKDCKKDYMEDEEEMRNTYRGRWGR